MQHDRRFLDCNNDEKNVCSVCTDTLGQGTLPLTQRAAAAAAVVGLFFKVVVLDKCVFVLVSIKAFNTQFFCGCALNDATFKRTTS